MDVLTANFGLYLSTKAFKLFARRFSSALTSTGTIEVFPCNRKSISFKGQQFYSARFYFSFLLRFKVIPPAPSEDTANASSPIILDGSLVFAAFGVEFPLFVG